MPGSVFLCLIIITMWRPLSQKEQRLCKGHPAPVTGVPPLPYGRSFGLTASPWRLHAGPGIWFCHPWQNHILTNQLRRFVNIYLLTSGAPSLARVERTGSRMFIANIQCGSFGKHCHFSKVQKGWFLSKFKGILGKILSFFKGLNVQYETQCNYIVHVDTCCS